MKSWRSTGEENSVLFLRLQFTVPGDGSYTEDFPLSTTNPYGSTKLMIEQILRDLYVSDESGVFYCFATLIPLGLMKVGELAKILMEYPQSHALYLTQVAIGKRERLGNLAMT